MKNIKSVRNIILNEGMEKMRANDKNSRTKQKSKFAKRLSDSKYLLLMIAPCVLYFIIFKYWPMFGLITSFQNYSVFKGITGSEWVGFKHYSTFFHDPYFFTVLKNTLLLGIFNTAWNFPMPIILALVINEIRSNKLKKFTQTVSYFPHFISVVILCGMVMSGLSPRGGIVNNIVVLFGGKPINFISDPKYFRTIYIASGIWQTTGWGTIIYLAALTGVNVELYDAAAVDGANRWQKLWNVTLPAIIPTIVVVLIMSVGRSVTIGFDKVFLLQNDANISTSEVISTYEYERGIIKGNYSYSAAIGLFMSVISSLLVIMTNTISRKLSDTALW